ncbi:GNAT family N-acetyltransferase [Deinococcus sp. MIMF12]|uniref:GNAT family N-acetyltransferase n=1 Tax=Deinococcus rhizophilus TaxID=3049544 RepID=A0ABT7JE24_9DEIO|nr:GNAT family N-acetyltransferase [Deinococcus rhizophilus]MDL2343302.1 GNAT family N-acetyltransferase [Deinococcus rhizophilus]
MIVRPFQRADAPAVADLVTRSVRGLWTYRPEHFREDARPEWRRLVAVRGGGVIATAHLAPFGDSAPDALRLDLAGEGAAFSPLYLALLARSELVRRPAGYTRLLGVTREDFSEKMTFFAAAGFRNAWQSWGAHLDLRGWDFGPFRALEERLFLEGYEVERWRMDAPEAEWQALHALHRQGEADVPRNPTTMTAPLDLPALREVMTREEAVFVVRRRGELLALTRLTLPRGQPLQGTGEVSSDLTATHPAHRGRGLATLVGAHALAWAHSEGYTRAGTGGAVLNLPMLRVNTRLGYVPEAMWVTWEKRLRTPDAAVRNCSEVSG